MNRPTQLCAEHVLALHALADGELDAMACVALEEHVRRCGACRAELDKIEHTRVRLSDPGLRDLAPETLRQRVFVLSGAHKELEGGALAMRRIAPWLGGAVGGALAASSAILLTLPRAPASGVMDALVDGQIRSLQSGHLVDVRTSDRHTVKPWFNGRIAYAPPVVDLKDQGFPLVGGRLDVIARENVAVLVYRRHLHTINLFIRPITVIEPSTTGLVRRAGYNVERWTSGGLEFWAVSDVEDGELLSFRQAFLRASSP